MIIMPFIGPIITSILFVIVFRKAGLNGPIIGLCVAPIIAQIVAVGLIQLIVVAGFRSVIVIAGLISIALTLLPLLVLAFKTWPPTAVSNIRSEK